MEIRMCAGAVWGCVGVAVLGDRAARWADVAGLSALYTGVIPLYLLLSCSLCRDAHFPLMLLIWPCGLITLRLISLRHTWSILENRLQSLWKRFLDLLRIFKWLSQKSVSVLPIWASVLGRPPRDLHLRSSLFRCLRKQPWCCRTMANSPWRERLAASKMSIATRRKSAL